MCVLKTSMWPWSGFNQRFNCGFKSQRSTRIKFFGYKRPLLSIDKADVQVFKMEPLCFCSPLPDSWDSCSCLFDNRVWHAGCTPSCLRRPYMCTGCPWPACRARRATWAPWQPRRPWWRARTRWWCAAWPTDPCVASCSASERPIRCRDQKTTARRLGRGREERSPDVLAGDAVDPWAEFHSGAEPSSGRWWYSETVPGPETMFGLDMAGDHPGMTSDPAGFVCDPEMGPESAVEAGPAAQAGEAVKKKKERGFS